MLTIIIVNILSVSLDIVSVDLHFDAGSYHSWLQLKDKTSLRSQHSVVTAGGPHDFLWPKEQDS